MNCWNCRKKFEPVGIFQLVCSQECMDELYGRNFDGLDPYQLQKYMSYMERIKKFIITDSCRAYWKTLKIHKQRGWSLKRGADIAIMPTSRCPLHCEDCPMFLRRDDNPRYPECTVEEWKRFIELYPEWISEIYITGGEPSLYPGIAELVNWLVKRGHHVCLFSNLWKPKAFFDIKKSYKFVLYPTYHHVDDINRFVNAYKQLEGKFRIVAIEMEEPKMLPFTKHKDKFNDDYWWRTNTMIHIPPDAPKTYRIFLGCANLYKQDGQ